MPCSKGQVETLSARGAETILADWHAESEKSLWLLSCWLVTAL